MEYVLQTFNLTKTYNNVNVVNNVNMNVIKGSIYGFVGRNGSGKTTLFRMVTGLINKNAGEISLFNSKNEIELTAARRRTAAIVETASIYLGLDAYTNLKVQATLLGIDPNCIQEVLKTVGLENTGKKKAKHFSLGMKQRLGLAMALILNPDFLMLDEPTNGLDPEGIVEFRELLLKLNRERNITILVSSHILGELSKIATHYGFIKNGELILEITNEKLVDLCRKKSVIKVNSVKKIPLIMDTLGFDYKILNETEFELYGAFTITDIAVELKKQAIEIYNIIEHNEDLESFYINLVGGKSHA